MFFVAVAMKQNKETNLVPLLFLPVSSGINALEQVLLGDGVCLWLCPYWIKTRQVLALCWVQVPAEPKCMSTPMLGRDPSACSLCCWLKRTIFFFLVISTLKWAIDIGWKRGGVRFTKVSWFWLAQRKHTPQARCSENTFFCNSLWLHSSEANATHPLPESAAVKQVKALLYHAEEYCILVSLLSGVHESSHPPLAFPRAKDF